MSSTQQQKRKYSSAKRGWGSWFERITGYRPDNNEEEARISGGTKEGEESARTKIETHVTQMIRKHQGAAEIPSNPLHHFPAMNSAEVDSCGFMSDLIEPLHLSSAKLPDLLRKNNELLQGKMNSVGKLAQTMKWSGLWETVASDNAGFTNEQRVLWLAPRIVGILRDNLSYVLPIVRKRLPDNITEQYDSFTELLNSMDAYLVLASKPKKKNVPGYQQKEALENVSKNVIGILIDNYTPPQDADRMTTRFYYCIFILRQLSEFFIHEVIPEEQAKDVCFVQ